MENVTLTTFTDPMMGLSYECEPVYRRLEVRFGGQIEFRTVMAGLVRDMSDFMTQEECSLGPEEGIWRYCARLAGIYKSEEAIAGLPIRMEGFHLFDAEHRSSYPLCIACEAAKLTDPGRAEAFFYRLRYATIAETRQTTREEELARVARLSGLEEDVFLRHFRGGAEAAFRADLALTRSAGIRGLPMCLVQYENRRARISPLNGYDALADAIRTVSGGKIKPREVVDKARALDDLLAGHPLISRMEVRFALDLSEGELRLLLRPYIERGRVLELETEDFYQANNPAGDET